MGNCHSVEQTEPLRCSGALIRVADDRRRDVEALLEKTGGRFYTYFEEADGMVEITGLTGPDRRVEGLHGGYLVIQDGGKMWCGYRNFVNHIRKLAPMLEDALFCIQDEDERFIDEFRIENRHLQYKRIQQGCG